jgi:SOS response regulatory protein OraA/RecX
MTDSERLTNYFFNILARQDYSSGVLRDKAVAKGYDESLVIETIEQFKDMKYVDDIRYTQNLIEQYAGYKGTTYITQKLMLKKIPREIIQSLLEEYDLQNQQPNQDFIRKIRTKYKFYSPIELDPKSKQKVLQYIARQGFSNPFEIFKLLEEN